VYGESGFWMEWIPAMLTGRVAIPHYRMSGKKLVPVKIHIIPEYYAMKTG